MMVNKPEILLLEKFNTLGGKHCQTAALRQVLEYRGLSVSEEMLLGLGGGIGFIYWYMKMMPAPFVGGRGGGKGDVFLPHACARIGGSARFHSTASSTRGYEELKNVLRSGNPACVMVDMAYLPYLALPDNAHFGGHSIAVFGINEDKDEVLVADRGKYPFTITIKNLIAAKNSKFPPFAPKNKLLLIQFPDKVTIGEDGIRQSLREVCDTMLRPPIRNIGLEGIKKWVQLLLKWPIRFRGLNLFGCLFNVFVYIEIGGTGGAAFRPMFARYLEEISGMINSPDLLTVAQKYRQSAEVWSRVAHAALPDDWGILKKFKELMLEKNRIFEAEDNSLDKLLAINEQMDPLMHRAALELEKNEGGKLDRLLENLQQNVQQLYGFEKEAAELLEKIISQKGA